MLDRFNEMKADYDAKDRILVITNALKNIIESDKEIAEQKPILNCTFNINRLSRFTTGFEILLIRAFAHIPNL